jgi:hypothetical protein
MEEDVDKTVASTEPIQIKFISVKSPDYRLEFVNGAFSNITPRGEIVCNFHLEYRDIPIEQSATVSEDGTAKLSPFVEAPNFTRDVKFGVIMNIKLAKDIIRMLGDKIKEIEGSSQAKVEEGTHQ